MAASSPWISAVTSSCPSTAKACTGRPSTAAAAGPSQSTDMYETRAQPLLSRARYIARLGRHAAAAAALVAASLGMGMAGYVYFEHLTWLDAFVDASMLLGGMGPVHNPQTAGGKLFAGLYALYSGLVFLVTVGVVLAPVMHRALHKFHWAKERAK